MVYADERLRKGLSYLFVAHVSGFEADSRGFPSSAEFARRLFPFEDAFEKLVAKTGGALVLTTANRRTASYAAYLPEALVMLDEISEKARKLGLVFTFKGPSNSNWTEYLNMLPSPKQVEQFTDQRLIAELERNGDNRTIPRDVDFYIDFASTDDAASAAEQLKGAGFTVEFDDARPSLKSTFRSVLSPEAIASLRERILPTAQAYGGQIDGWACHVQSSPKASIVERVGRFFRKP